MDKNTGEITSIRLESNGASITIAHGAKKKQSDETKNSMACEYDSRPTTSVHVSSDEAKEYSVGKKVGIKLVLLDDESSSESSSENKSEHNEIMGKDSE